MLNIVIPMAGRGSRFVQGGYEMPKPLIPIHGRKMIQVVIENLRPGRGHRFIFLCLADHLREYDLAAELEATAPGCVVVPVDQVTEGAACTVLLAKTLIDNEDGLMIANSDQWIDVSIDAYLAVQDQARYDGLIMTMKADDPKWSFVGLDRQGLATIVVEKEVISDEATVGIYNFARGSDFVRGAEQMLRKNLRVNGEFYVAPVYNELILEGGRIGIHNIGSEGAGMYGIGIPKDYEAFVANPISRKATDF